MYGHPWSSVFYFGGLACCLPCRVWFEPTPPNCEHVDSHGVPRAFVKEECAHPPFVPRWML